MRARQSGRRIKGAEESSNDPGAGMVGNSDPGEDAFRHVKLSDHVYERIFELIVSGEYPTNSRLPSELELAERFKVSRPVVREALGRLRDDDLIVSRQGSGSYVSRQPAPTTLRFAPLGSIADIQRCFEFRCAIEGCAAALAAERRTEEDLAKLLGTAAKLREAVEAGSLGAEADFLFHMTIAEAGKNRFLLTALRSVEPHAAFGIRLARSLSLTRPRARLFEVQSEHDEICSAIVHQDAGAAERAMLRHLGNARRRVFEGDLEGS